MPALTFIVFLTLLLAACSPGPATGFDDPNRRTPDLRGRSVRIVFNPGFVRPEDRHAAFALLTRIGATLEAFPTTIPWSEALGQRTADVAIVPEGEAVDEDRFDVTEALGAVILVTRQSDRLRAALNAAIKLERSREQVASAETENR